MQGQTRHRHVAVDGMDILYREAGPANGPTVLLLHGFPSSSVQFRFLLESLSDRWRLVAPDLPGFGLSTTPDRTSGPYSFHRMATTIGHFVDALQLQPRAMYLHDYGAQVGFRLLTQGIVQPDALVIQNSEAHYGYGRQPAWSTLEAYWRDPSAANRERIRTTVLTEDGIRREFVEALPPELAELVPPEVAHLAWEHIRRPDVAEVNLDLHLDYATNVEHYEAVQEYLRTRQPPTMVIWGIHDQYYTADAAHAYKRELPDARVHLLDGGHWVLETHPAEVTRLTDEFLTNHVPPQQHRRRQAVPRRNAVRVGVATTLSGEAAKLGEEMMRAVQIAVDECNSAGGIKGVKVELGVRDDEGDEKAGLAVASAFCTDADVLAVVGHCFGSVSIPASDIYSQHGVPVLTPIASEPYLTDHRLPGVFRFTNRDDRTAAAIAGHLYHDRGKRRAFICASDSVYGHSMSGQFRSEFEKLGAAVVDSVVVPEGTREFDELATGLADDVDVVFYGGSFEGTALLKALRRAGRPELFAAGDGCWDRWNFLEPAAGDATSGEGVLVLSATPEVGKVDGSAEFARRYADRYGEEIGNYAVNSYDVTRLLLSAVEQATEDASHPPGRHEVHAAIRRARFEGIAYQDPVQWNERGDNLAAGTALHVVRDGRFQQIAWVPNYASLPAMQFRT